MNQDTQPLGDDINVYGDVNYILTLIDAKSKSTSWLLGEGVHRIGRIKGMEILLDDITVSRKHGIITVEGDDIDIEDIDSTNGIFLNGELITNHTLNAGDRLQIGKFVLLLVRVNDESRWSSRDS